MDAIDSRIGLNNGDPKIAASNRGDRAARQDLPALAARLDRSLAKLHPSERLQQLRREVAGRIVFTTSFGLEDQAIFHLLCIHDIDVEIVTLDTGRLFTETHTLWAETEQRYRRRIGAVYPKHHDLELLIAKHGINGFYASVEARVSCCHVRKVEPLNRALAGANAWITGMRADQSQHRNDIVLVSVDAERRLVKANPLFDWRREAVLDFTRESNVPINPLHATGFASISCAPCTRAIRPGEPERAGRWWWEDGSKKECGLHVIAGNRQKATAETGS